METIDALDMVLRLAAGVAPWIVTGAAVAIMVMLIVLCRMIETKLNLKDHP
jgi:hypothetical protein